MSEIGCLNDAKYQNLEIQGDLTVLGAMSSIETVNTVIKDTIVELNSGATVNANGEIETEE